MKTWLLDGNVLAALAIGSHPHHERCRRWLADWLGGSHRFATCPITEGSLIRLHARYAEDPSPAAGGAALAALQRHPAHDLWLNNFSYSEVSLDPLQAHRQITDAWLVELARRRGGKLVTLDASVATLYPEDAFLIPVLPGL